MLYLIVTWRTATWMPYQLNMGTDRGRFRFPKEARVILHTFGSQAHAENFAEGHRVRLGFLCKPPMMTGADKGEVGER